MTLPSLASFWHGGPLAAIEMASLHSFVALGHPVTVYSHAPIANLPGAVEWRDADEILPTDKVAVHRKHGSSALHSNFFRYAMFRKTEHLWVDLDIVALRPLAFEGGHVFGYETPASVNGAVLRLPKDSPALELLSRLGPHTRGVAPHIKGLRRLKYWVRTFGRGYPIDEWVWGSAGPRALTTYLTQTGEIRHARPVEAFYPIGVNEHQRLLEPGLTPESFGPETYAVHLWASRLRKTLAERHGGAIPPDSFTGRVVERARKDGFDA
ncbi:hypothetical protein [Rubellimicrobium aerolatum]|uniref:Alpha 1,4-glycosyltransferase domain-containing protein n=1 Tax=Rubellimicrobium aerolatum TaxID=490979 RepID=A0ABW0SD73_9RHOB|nr:hypothetical protein [Rubellimicrobium aerolatum]MBP1806547.1 hypothetical protein [Rubellimicrobium aerolatum]